VKDILGGVKIEDVMKTVGTVFKDLPNEKNIHIVVEAPPVQYQGMRDLIKQLDATHLDHDQSLQEKTKLPERSLLHRAFRKHDRPRPTYREKIRIVNYISYEELSDLYDKPQKEKEQDKK
ncbi:13815_t:CDS:2, partial [Funneliformis caledonium]